MNEASEIKNGIEWPENDGSAYGWCARCGSSIEFRDCWNCGGDGFVERDNGDDACEDLYDAPCEYCLSVGGRWHCISSPEYCTANPMAGREAIESTALNPQAWRDND